MTTAFKTDKLMPGSYRATVSGYESTIVRAGSSITFKFNRGVRGIGIKDAITVNPDGTVFSDLLGQAYDHA